MSNNKCTPGPWAATTRQGSWDWVVYSKENPHLEICQMFNDGTDENETGEANAMLVAAAPDLLAECEKQIIWLRHIRTRITMPESVAMGFDQAVKGLSDAIAKTKIVR